jgi:hypothetical protein
MVVGEDEPAFYDRGESQRKINFWAKGEELEKSLAFV